MFDCKMNHWRFGFNQLARLFHCSNFKEHGSSSSCKNRHGGTATLLLREASAWVKVATAVPEGLLVIAPHPNEQLAEIITSPEMNPHTFFACDSIKDNRCWECLEGTKIKDYFIIWIPLGREVLRFILSCTERSKQHFILLMLWQFWSWASDREWMLFNLGELSVLENSVNYLCVSAQSAFYLETQRKLQARMPKRH